MRPACCFGTTTFAQQSSKPNIVLIVSDDFGYGDSGPYGGGVGRGMPTPNLDRMADEGMTFFTFYAQPSCTPGRLRDAYRAFPNRSGMTTVAFQGQVGGLTEGGMDTWITVKERLATRPTSPGNRISARPTMRCRMFTRLSTTMNSWVFYHLNAYTYADPCGFLGCAGGPARLSGQSDQGDHERQCRRKAHEDFKVNGEYVDTPVINGKEGVVGIPYLDEYIEKAALKVLD